ncbi:MAG: glycine betaine transporter, partial [Myxococcota bacterium]
MRRVAAHLTLFRISLPLCLGVALWGILSPETLASNATALQGRVFDALDWFFMGSVTTFLLVAISLAISKYGRLRLGGPDSKPDFSTASWLSMLFSAGIGSGLLFWGVAEPVTHFAHPPGGVPGSTEAARGAMLLTNFHWGLHAWAVYGMAALVLGFFAFRRGTPYLAGAPIREGFSGRWVKPVAGGADLLAVVGVAFGVAGALVMGVQQLQAGLNVTLGLSADSKSVGLMLLGFITVAFLISSSTSLDK